MSFRKTILLLFIISVAANATGTNSIDSLRLLVGQSGDTSRIRHINEIASFYYKTAAFDSALKNANAAIELQKQFDSPQQLIVSCGIIMNIYYNEGKYNLSREMAFKGLEAANKINDIYNKILFHTNIANTYERQGKSEVALDNYLQGLSLAEKQRDSIKVAELYSSLGAFYLNKDNFDMALLSHRKSLSILLAKHNTDSVSFNYVSLATSYSNMGNLMARYYIHKVKPKTYVDSALYYYNKGIAITRKINDSNRLSVLLINASDSYNMMGNYTKAIDLLMEASEIVSHTDNFAARVVTCINLGDAYRGLNNIDVSIQYLKKAIELARQAGAKLFISESYLSLSKTYEKVNRYNEAFESYKAYSNYRDSILDTQSSGVISEMMAQYETDKKETEIELLTKDSELQQHQIGKQKVIRNIVLSGLFLITVLSLLLLGRYRLSKRLNIEFDKTNTLIYNKNRLIMDSIDYAERIQQLILPPMEMLNRHFSDSFTVYFPKDVISGDIYWFTKRENIVLLAAVDCTGHGVPGALMSMVAYNLLNRAVNSTDKADATSVISNVNRGLQNFVAQSDDKMNVRDGMDIALCSIDLNTLQLNFAGAQNPAYIVRDKHLTEFKGEHVSMGDPAFVNHVFCSHQMELKRGDWLYLITDGYADQKGGPNNKKFYYQPLKDLITGISDLSGVQQKQKLEDVFNEWKGKGEQLDDVLIIGVKI